MSTLSYAARDSATMLTRDLRHALRYPSMTIGVVAIPVIFLLLFAYVFGGAIGAGISGGARGGARYIDYLAPGIIIMTAASTGVATAVSVCIDMTQGIVARFRTMAIFRPSLLTGHVVGSVIKTMLAIGFVIGVALLIGFRPTTDPIRWIAAIGLLAMFTFALTWLSVALGLVSKSPETASNLPIPLTLLPFLGSGFVPADTMPVGLRWFAEYQPFTAITETLRGLLMGTPIGNNAVLAVAWCAGITLVGFFWAKALFNRDPAR
jgi:ABC-2 type transport system permease protein